MWRPWWNDANECTEIGAGEVAVEVCCGRGMMWSSSGNGTVPAHMVIDRSGIEHMAMFETFLNRRMLQEAIAYCLDNLKNDRPANVELQTNVLQVNLMKGSQVSEVILQQNIWHNYDESKIAQL